MCEPLVVIGATLVEVDAAVRLFCRQINASDDGAFQDLDVRVSEGRATTGCRVEAITWGDIHRRKLDPVVARAAWGIDLDGGPRTAESMIDALRPRYQVHHDLLDFEGRNHHRRGDHAFRFKMQVEGRDSVDDEGRQCATFLRETAREWCTTVVPAANHNVAFPRWLREADPREDPVNALIWFRPNTAVYEAIERGDEGFDPVRWLLARHDPRGLEDKVFVPRNGSYVICQEHGGSSALCTATKGPTAPAARRRT